MATWDVLVMLLAFVYLFNLPFGYWRAATRKMSKEWALAIHLPVPAIVGLRLFYGIGLEVVPLFILAFFLGQFSGGRIRRTFMKVMEPSKCLPIDLIRILSRKV